MTRDIIILTKEPDLRKRWINAIVEYIRENYSDESLVTVDAIVGPDTKGYLFAFAVALELHLPYFRIQEARQLTTNDLFQTKFKNRENEVDFLF